MLNTARKYGSNSAVLDAGELKQYLLIPQVMAICGISRNSIYKYVAEGELKAILEKQGNRTVFKFAREEVDRFNKALKETRSRGKRLT